MKKILAIFIAFMLVFSTIGLFTSQVFAEGETLTATFDVSNGFEKEVQLDSYTTINWTLVNGEGTYELVIDLPGKQLPAAGWKEFYEEKGWATAQTNEYPLAFSDGSTGTLIIDVIGNSGKVRFFIEVEESEPVEVPIDESTQEEEGRESKEVISEKEFIVIVEDKEVIIELDLEAGATCSSWYVWINHGDEPIIKDDKTVILEDLAPGTHHIKVECRDDDGNIIDEYETIFTVSTDDGGVLPETATLWPNLLLSALALMGLGFVTSRFLNPAHLSNHE